MKSEHNPFSKLALVQAPKGLSEAISLQIGRLERRARVSRLGALSVVALTSVAAFVGSCAYVWSAIAASGFGQYLSFALSDSSALTYSKDLLLSMVESLPVFGVALVLAAGLAAAWSLVSCVRFVRARASARYTYA